MFMAKRLPIDPFVSAFSYQTSASGENWGMISLVLPLKSFNIYHANDEDLGGYFRTFIGDLLHYLYDGVVCYRLVPLKLLSNRISNYYSCTTKHTSNIK